ncbi:ArgS-related anticodon-binding protein NrtL [Streptomyces sp. NPDC054887]
MTPAELSRTVLRAVRRAVDADVLRAPVPERAVVERPRPGGRGDYATNVALKLAGPSGRPAREVAEILRAQLIGYGPIVDVEVTGPGFLNFTLARDVHASVVRTVLAQGLAYGHADALAGDVVRAGSGLLGDAVARIAHAMGASVVRTGDAGQVRDARGVSDVTGVSVASDGGGRERDRGAGGALCHGDGAPARSAPPAAEHALVARLGRDAAVWHLVWPTATAVPDDLLVQREINPLFRVRYAHAHIRSLVRAATHLGFTASATTDLSANPDVSADPDVGATPNANLTPNATPDADTGEASAAEAPTAPHPSTRPLLRALADHPAVLEAAARHRAPDRLARHLDLTAEAFFRFHDAHPVLPLGDEKPSVAHRSRLALAEATGTVLAGGLSLLGISAPEHL